MAGSVKDTDNGYARVRKELFRDDTNGLEVGVMGHAALAEYENGALVWEAALWAEFGTRGPNGEWHEPPRRWLSGWFDQNRDMILFWAKNEMLAVVRGTQTKEQALENVGRRCVNGVKQGILKGLPPGNAPSTIRQKGFDFPLFRTGKLVNAVTHKVVRR